MGGIRGLGVLELRTCAIVLSLDTSKKLSVLSLPEPHAWREKSYLTASLPFIRGESWLVLETVVYETLLPPASSMSFCRCPFEVNHFKNDKWLTRSQSLLPRTVMWGE